LPHMRNSRIGALRDAPDRMAAVGVGHDVAVAATSLTFQKIVSSTTGSKVHQTWLDDGAQ